MVVIISEQPVASMFNLQDSSDLKIKKVGYQNRRQLPTRLHGIRNIIRQYSLEGFDNLEFQILLQVQGVFDCHVGPETDFLD